MNSWTPTQLLEALLTLSSIMSIVVYAVGKHIMPWVWEKLTGAPDPQETDAERLLREAQAALTAKVLKLETNHMAHFKADHEELRGNFNEYIVRKEIEDRNFRETVLQRLTAVETMIRQK